LITGTSEYAAISTRSAWSNSRAITASTYRESTREVSDSGSP
jgi:hypothetical protein